MPWTVRRQLLGFGVLVAGIAVALLAAPETVVEFATPFVDDPVLFAVTLVLIYAIRPLLVLPTMAVAALVGFGYGLAVGIPIALLGTTLSSLPPYFLGRYLRTGEGMLGRWCVAGEDYFTVTGDTRGVVAARIAPVPSDAISYAAGLSRVPPRPFLVGTAIGELHWTILAVVAGASARHVTAGTMDSVSPVIVFIAVIGALVLVAGPLYRNRIASGSGE